MEAALLEKNKSENGNRVKEEKKSSEDDDHRLDNKVPPVNMNETSMETDAENQKSRVEEESEEEQLKSARAEMDNVIEENERLKSVLGQLVKDYQSLHVHFLQVLEQEATKKATTDNAILVSPGREDEEPELVSLSLGTRASEPRKRKESNNSHEHDQDERLKLGLDCRFDEGGEKSTETAKRDSTVDENSMEEGKDQEEPNAETWPPSKFPKTARSAEQDDEVLQQSHLKKPRVSIRARCDTPTMNDGCQWRKYGQKIAKGNPCPRAYYRCTISPTCPVRKQVQRCADDMSVLITTYEGNHNHPLPISATAMASTTSAAAAMLNSRSSSSQPGLGTSTSANLHGLNFTLPYSSVPSSSSAPPHLYFPHSTITTSNSHPTITLDLTAQSTFSNFNRFSSTIPRPSPSCLSFSSQQSSEAFHHTPFGHPNSPFNYTSGFPNYSKNSNNGGSGLSIGTRQLSPLHEHFYQMQQLSQNQNPSLTDTIAAATKAITSNPTFRSALTAALTSYVGNGVQENQIGRPPASVSGGFPFAQSGSTVGCASSFLNKSPSLGNSHSTHQPGSLALFPPALRQGSGSKSGSGSPPDDNKEHAK